MLPPSQPHVFKLLFILHHMALSDKLMLGSDFHYGHHVNNSNHLVMRLATLQV